MRGVALLAVVAITGVARAQETVAAVDGYRVDVWRAEHGLPVNVVGRIAQSADGYLWLATTNGATRFDGVRFTTFDHTNTPAFRGRIDYAIQPMLGDRRGVLWIATDRELVRYADGRFVRDAALDDSVVGEAIAGLTEDSNGTLWALTDHGRLLRRDGSRLAPVPIGGLPRAVGQSITAGDSGQLWLGFAGYGLMTVHPRDGTVTTVFRDQNVRAILRARDGTIWAATTTGIAHVAAGRIERLPLVSPDRYAIVTALGEDREGGLWVGTQGNGLYRYDAGRFTELTANNDLLTNDDVLCVSVDAEGSVWVGTRHGLNRFHTVELSPLVERNGLPTAAPGAIAIDRSGALWMAPRTGGLYRRTHADSGPFVSMRPTDIVSSIAVGTDSAVWIGRRRSGVQRYHAGSWRAFGTGSANAVLADRSGRVWIATSAGLQRLWHDQLTTLTERDGLVDSVVFCLTEDSRGAIWAGTSRGLSRIDPSGGDRPTITSYRVADGLGASIVIALLGTTDGAVWAGTVGGLTRIAGGRLVTIRSEHGLVPELVSAMAEDGTGHLWLAGFRGLRRVPLADLNAVADSVARGRPAQLGPVPTFLPSDGLPSPEVAVFVQQPTATAANGRLWFAMERGLVSLDPRQVHENTDPLVVHIERVTIDGVQAPDGLPLTIGPRARRLEFEYTAVSLQEGLHVRFRYRLGGFDTTWVDADGSRTASYTNLSPGRYRFSVAARAADGPWGANDAEVAFRVLPPFYLTPWFLIAATIATVLAVTLALRARTRVLEARFAAVLAERTRLAREIHDTLLQGFAGVALSLRAATRRLNAPADYTKPLDDVLALAQRTIADARQAVWDLRAPALAEGSFTTALENAARQTLAGSGLELEWTVAGRPRTLRPDVEGVLLRTAQEALANTVKHASAHRAWVELIYERRVARLTVRDDGCGFHIDPSYRSYAGHWGLLGMRERVEQAHGTLRVMSEEGKGTEVSLTVPYG
jgi:signal transduction histidine kinase/ligand-binding sensor domain-containing protein